MSWIETALVISTSSNLVVRAKFGRLLHFKNHNGYNENDKIKLIFSNNGSIKILENEHNPTTEPPNDTPEINDINYTTLYRID